MTKCLIVKFPDKEFDKNVECANASGVSLAQFVITLLRQARSKREKVEQSV